MGFDLYGLAPKSEAGEYFRLNFIYWPILWRYIGEICDFEIPEYHRGFENAGQKYDEEIAVAIADRIDEVLKDEGSIRFKFELDGNAIMFMLTATALLEDSNGKGNLDFGLPESDEEFQEGMLIELKRFGDFCRNCGGFVIY